jgi:hypothetical protein
MLKLLHHVTIGVRSGIIVLDWFESNGLNQNGSCHTKGESLDSGQPSKNRSQARKDISQDRGQKREV